MAGSSLYGLYEGFWGFIRRLTSYSADIDATVSSTHRRPLAEQNYQGRAAAPVRSASLVLSHTVTAGSRTVSSGSPGPSVAHPSTPRTPNQSFFRIPQTPQAPRAPIRAPRTARALMPPFSPLDLDASSSNHRASNTRPIRPILRNIPPLDPAYEQAKRDPAGPLQRPHAARPSPMGLTRTGTLIIGDPDYTGPLHEMQSVHALGRRHVSGADRDSDAFRGREDDRRRPRAPIPPTPTRRTVSSPDIRRGLQQAPPIASSLSAPDRINPRSNARNRRLLRVNQSISAHESPAGPSGSSTAPLLPAIAEAGPMNAESSTTVSRRSRPVQAAGPSRRRRRRTLCLASTPSSRTLHTSSPSSAPSPPAQEASSLPASQAGPSHQAWQAMGYSPPNPADATTSNEGPKPDSPRKRAREVDSKPTKAPACGPSQENVTHSPSPTISPLPPPRRRDPSTESRWSNAAVARGGGSSPLRAPNEPLRDEDGNNTERRKKRRTDADQADGSSTWSTEARRGGEPRHHSWEWDRSVNEAIQTWSTAATDGGFGSRTGSVCDFDDLESSISSPPSGSGDTFEIPPDIMFELLRSPLSSSSSTGSSARKRSRDDESPVRSERNDINMPDSESRSSPVSTIYSFGQSPPPSSRDRSESRRPRRDGTHSDPESNIPELRPRRNAPPPSKRHRSY